MNYQSRWTQSTWTVDSGQLDGCLCQMRINVIRRLRSLWAILSTMKPLGQQKQTRPQIKRIDKPLPMTPPPPPAPLASRRFLDMESPAPLKPTKRSLSWSEDQINTLQDENRKLRQQIIEQKRLNLEKNELISQLRQETVQYDRRLCQQKEMVKQIANTIIVAFQDYDELASHGIETRKTKGSIEEFIQIYKDL